MRWLNHFFSDRGANANANGASCIYTWSLARRPRAQLAGYPTSMFTECFRYTKGLEQPASKLFY